MKDEVQKKLKAQMDGIAVQIEDMEQLLNGDCVCMEILARIAQIRAALNALSVEMLTEYVKSCLAVQEASADTSPLENQRRLAEVQAALHRLIR